MADVHREVELKYTADATFGLPSLTELVAGTDVMSELNGFPLSDGVSAQQRLDAVYFDTEDLRLAAAGLTLRRRTGGDDSGWHLKVPVARGTRSEVRLPPGRVPPGRTPRAVPEQLQAMVWSQTLGRALQPIARITTERTVQRLTDPTGRVLVELADDRVTAQRLLPLDGTGEAAGAATHWREIEVELGDDAADLLDAVDARMRRQGLQTAAAESKLAQVLDGATPKRGGHDPKADPDRRLTTTSAAGDVLLAYLHQQVQQVRAHDLPVRLEAPDAVHKMRVATRRLRSALTTFKPLVDPEVVRPLRAELKWLASELGAARDAEVMLARVRTAIDTDDQHLRLGADAALAELEQAYRTAHDRVLAELDGDRYHQILTALCALVEQPPFRKSAKASARKRLPALVRRSYDRVHRFVDRGLALPAGAERDEAFHDARKAAKRARYAGESVAPAIGADATAFAVAMEDVQEALGERQDSILTAKRLRTLAQHAPSTEVAFLYGRLYAQEEARAEQIQQRFSSAWKAAGRKSVRRWLS